MFALMDDIDNLYSNDGQTFELNYGNLWPESGKVYGAIASQFKNFPGTKNLDSSPNSIPYTLLCEIEIRVKGNQGIQDFGLIYDHHEFIVNHLLKSIRTSGITGTYEGNNLSKAFLGLQITKAIAGFAMPQDDLSKLRSLINFEWRYTR